MNVSVRFVNGIPAALNVLRASFPQAEARAVNRAAVAARTLLSSNIARDMGLKVGRVRDAMRLTQAVPGNPVARLSASMKRIPLIEFNAKGPEPSRGKGKGVTAKMPGGRGRYPNAFIATMRSGHRGVFERATTKRLPIHELKGASIGKVFIKYLPDGVARTREQLVKNLQSEFSFAMRSTSRAA